MAAATGYPQEVMVKMNKQHYLNHFKAPSKLSEFTLTNLSSSKYKFNKGGQVTAVLKDQIFILFYDNINKF